jgi:hypothetical protein
VLAPNLDAELAAAHSLPHLPLGRRQWMTKVARALQDARGAEVAFGFGHESPFLDSPSPQPSPSGRGEGEGELSSPICLSASRLLGSTRSAARIENARKPFHAVILRQAQDRSQMLSSGRMGVSRRSMWRASETGASSNSIVGRKVYWLRERARRRLRGPSGSPPRCQTHGSACRRSCARATSEAASVSPLSSG